MTADRQLHRARVISSIAATVISLACGTNYVYSAWAPQFADRLLLSATETNLIGLAGNLGMYSMGVPVGILVDKNPRLPVILGAFLLGIGYWPLHTAYDNGRGSVPLMCFFSYLTGLGGCMAFACAVKCSALNWPGHRGTATAFPLAAFGLSAFFFSLLSLIFPGDPGRFLEILAGGTFLMTFLGYWFLRVLPHTHYHAVPDADHGLTDSQQLHRTTSADSKANRAGRGPLEPGTSPNVNDTRNYEDRFASISPSDAAGSQNNLDSAVDVEAGAAARNVENEEVEDMTETSSLMSHSTSASSLPGAIIVQNSVDMDRSHRVDIRGFKLLKNVEFWQLFTIMAILSGIGLMTINNIGHDAQALWKKYDSTIDGKTLALRQQMHVSILSIGSFTGRLLSGVGSDYLVKVLHASRVWCLAIASIIFGLAQIFALTITNPHLLGLVSSFSGLGYGFLFGVFPSIVAESFGIHGLSQNWGFMTLSPVISSNIFNIFYGAVFDAHSIVEEDGSRSCNDGIDCYWSAYLVTLGACGVGIVVTLWVIWHQKQERLKEAGKSRAED